MSTAGVNLGTTAFDPYGGVLGVSGTQQVFGYQSDLTDALTKQVDMGTRWYAPSQGRFSSRDALFGDPMSPISLNQWIYGGANPITMHDPTGMRDLQCTELCDSNTEQRNANAYSEASGQVASGSDRDWQGAFAAAVRIVPPEPPSYLVTKMKFSDPSAMPCDQCFADPSLDMTVAEKQAMAAANDGDPGCGGWNFWRCGDDAVRGAWVGTRAVLNAPWTAGGTAYASWVQNADCDWEAELTVACYGADADGPRDGIAIGNTYITNKLEATARTLIHERKHSDQWALLGGAFPVLYWADYKQDEWLHEGDGCHQFFEQLADLEDGGYTSC